MTGATYFATPEREDKEKALADSRALSTDPDLQLLLKVVPEFAGVLNEQRQFLLANDALLGLLSARDLEEIVGSRPGEALGCVNAWDSPAGCGTGESCQYCGAVAAISEALETGRKASHECRVTAERGGEVESLDLLVAANPITVNDQLLTLLTLADISDAKRRRSLERVFFHDILNSASALHGLIELLQDYKEDDFRLELEYVSDLSGRLLDEIVAQRDLFAAESGELHAVPERVDAAALLGAAAGQFRSGNLAEGKDLLVRQVAGEIELSTDKRLLFRIVTNMLKNALEATGEGGTVTAGVERAGGRVRFRVRNPGVIPREAELQVFQRSFSTRGAGRGLGTYSMKLLGERYLKGEVSFTTSEREGTEFSITLPESLGIQPA